MIYLYISGDVYYLVLHCPKVYAAQDKIHCLVMNCKIFLFSLARVNRDRNVKGIFQIKIKWEDQILLLPLPPPIIFRQKPTNSLSSDSFAPRHGQL